MIVIRQTLDDEVVEPSPDPLNVRDHRQRLERETRTAAHALHVCIAKQERSEQMVRSDLRIRGRVGLARNLFRNIEYGYDAGSN